MYRILSRGLVTLLAISMLISALPLMAMAQETPTGSPEAVERRETIVQILLRPDGKNDGERLEVEMKPGEDKELRVFIGNLGNVMLSVFTFTANISTKINGGMQVSAPDLPAEGPTTWIDYPTETYELEPGIEVARDFPVKVPEGTPPGDYVIPISVETTDSFEVPGAGQLRQKVRKTIPIYITVPGEANPGFELGVPEVVYIESGAALQIPVANTGQTTLRLMGTVQVTDGSGATLLEAPIAMGAVYGNMATTIRVRFEGIPPAGEHFVTIALLDILSDVTDGFENEEVTIPEPPSDELLPLVFESIAMAPNADPIQFLSIITTIANNAASIPSSRLTLVVTKDGESVEDFVLAENLLLEQGVTGVSQRYLPITGWESGSYSFTLKLESVDPNNGAVSLLLTSDPPVIIDIP